MSHDELFLLTYIEAKIMSPQEPSWAEIQPGNTRQNPGQKPSLYNLLYCLNCVSELGSKVTEYTTPGSVWGREDEPQAAKGGQIHKVRCSCGERFWKLAEWERHEVEQSWETPTEPHLAQCEKCSNQVFERRERFLGKCNVPKLSNPTSVLLSSVRLLIRDRSI